MGSRIGRPRANDVLVSEAPRPTPPSASPRQGRDAPSRVELGDFSDDQKEGFRALSASMSFVGACLVLFGALFGAFALVAFYAGFPWAALGLLAVAAVYGPTGWWTSSAGRALAGIVRTRGSDIKHLMDAVRELRRLFGFAVGIIVVQTLAMTALAGALAWCSVIADKGSRCLTPF